MLIQIIIILLDKTRHRTRAVILDPYISLSFVGCMQPNDVRYPLILIGYLERKASLSIDFIYKTLILNSSVDESKLELLWFIVLQH